MEMRNICRMALLGAGIILSLAGCQKGNTPGETTGKTVKFNATSGSIDTRAVFSGDGTGTATDDFGRKILSHERINWEKGDQVMIASDYATVYGGTNKYATYTVFNVTPSGDLSYATLEEKDTDELFFIEGQDSYKFWSVYPASAGFGRMLQEQHKVEYRISQRQAPFGAPVVSNHTIKGKDVTLTTLAPDLTREAVMLAAAENQTEQAKVELKYYPAFTAFEFTLNSRDVEQGIKQVVLTTAEGKALCGTVVASVEPEGRSTFSDIAYYPDGKLIYTFPENSLISPTKYLTFTVLALPEDVKGLTLEFTMNDGTVTRAKLQNKADHSPMEFAACKKHCLRGIAVPGGWKFLWLDINVMEWTEIETTQSNDHAVQATQFAVSGASNLRELKDAVNKVDANKDYRQCWGFAPGETVTVKYKIMMPDTGTWEVEKFGDTGDFTVTVTSSASEDAVTPTGNKYSGALVAGSTYITMTITSTATTMKTLYFKTTASDGTSNFSLDSETQLYDMRGYHYFIVNGDATTTFANLNIQ